MIYGTHLIVPPCNPNNNRSFFTNSNKHMSIIEDLKHSHMQLSFIKRTEQVTDLLQATFREFLISFNHLNWVLGLALLRILHLSLLPLHLETLLECLTRSLWISEIKSSHLDGLSGCFICQ